MNKIFLTLSLLVVFTFTSFSQIYYGNDANNLFQGSEVVKIKEGNSLPEYIKFRAGSEIIFNKFEAWLSKSFNFSDEIGIQFINIETDIYNHTHYRCKLTFNNIPLHNSMFIIHVKDNKVYAINGNFYSNINPANSISLSESQALNSALAYVNAEKYKWEIPEEEVFIKELEDNPLASFYPKGELVILTDKNTGNHQYSYKFDVYAHKPMSRADIYVDASSGAILLKNDKIHFADSIGTAVTKYSANRTITTDYHNSTYRLRESGRGNGIETYDMNTGTSYGSAVDFTDSDNYWNNVNSQKDEIASDAHWGMEMTYDYYWNRYNRNSINGNGFKLKSYVHYDVNYANAFWNSQYMTFGDGNSSMQPLVALDIVGHEISHGLTEFTADLDYAYESGALNEGFSDIFGTAIEFYAKGTQGNWLIGENIGNAMRSMSNPNSKGDPDTYLGNYYYTGTADNGGVHTNSSVLNYWFYLVSQGGSGTNDNNDAYSVTGISIDSAAAIAFRMLTVYLTNTSQFDDARFYSIVAAADLFGNCSAEVEAVTNAWHAVGVGSAYIAGVQADFTALVTNFCAPPAIVKFTNLSNNAMNFHWDFGDNTTSTQVNPTHTYTSFGDFAVKLIADGAACGKDSILKTEYISVDTANPCIVYMPTSGSSTQTNCFGTLFDSGGPSNYQNNTNVRTTISPAGASQITLTFTAFSFESGFDYLKIYDGATINSPLIGSYDGNTLPNGGTITSSGGAITLVQETDQGLTDEGFIANWACQLPTAAPVIDFLISDSVSCSGDIKFTDKSLNGPVSWSWDFGDGTYSNSQHPSHTYTSSGVYSVKLEAVNIIGTTSLTKSNLINIGIPETPNGVSKAKCDTGIFILGASVNSGKLMWYDAQSGGNFLDTGAVYTTPPLTQSTTYYVENIIEQPTQNVGKINNLGGGGNLTSTQSLIFDTYKPIVIKSVKVYGNSSGNRTVKLKSSTGVTLQTKVINVINGSSRVELNFEVPVGTDFRLEGSNLYRNNNGVNYPYEIQDLVKIKYSSAGTNPSGYYYWYYDWEVKEQDCTSPRVAVTAFVSHATPQSSFTYISYDPRIEFSDQTTNPGVCHWDFGDGNFSNLSNPTHTYSANGTYTVKQVVDNGCGKDSTTQTITIIATGISGKIGFEKISLYPNPTVDNIFINFGDKELKDYCISINSITGQNLLNFDLNSFSGNYEIKLDKFAKGLYFVRISNTNGSVTKKVIIH
ncbi:MAG: M4 family metallopeptidase [Saprospiraceae bacterium]|nr:M4 family metallopeptidase [Saprospiraceae bacterium]